MSAILVRNADRMMTVAAPLEEGIELGFADGAKGVIPYSDVPEIKDCSRVKAIELPNPYELVVKSAAGEIAEIPWDFARHYCDSSYRSAMEVAANKGRSSLGDRVRQLRISSRLTQQQLARAARVGRVTIVRVECGKQSPRFTTLKAVADALGVSLAELLVESNSIGQ